VNTLESVLKFPTSSSRKRSSELKTRASGWGKRGIGWVVLLLPVALFGQVELNVSGSPLDRNWQGKKFATRERAVRSLDDIRLAHHAHGFLEMTLDTVWELNRLKILIHPGPIHVIGELSITGDSLLPGMPQAARKKRPTIMSGAAIESRLRAPVTYLENHGYPFARIELTHLSLRDSLWSLRYTIYPGDLIRLDSVIIKSNDNLPERYIRNHLGWKKGEPYSEEQLTRIRPRLLEIPFVAIRQSPDILFRQSEADIYLYLERKKANSFNGIVGLQPIEGGGVTLTGDLEIRLLNAMQRGEEIYFNWRRIQSETQELHAKTRIPYLFNSPFGTEGWVRVYRRDSTFSSFRGQLALAFNLHRGAEWKVFVEQNSTSRLSRNIPLSDYADVRATLYGVALSTMHLDYRYNPRRGTHSELEIATGRRRATRPGATDDQPNTIQTNTYRIQARAGSFIPLFGNQTLHFGVNGAALFADAISENELFRIGGLKSIRGIDEEGIFARAWTVFTAEYRIILETNSALYIYADQGWYEATRSFGLVTDSPLGFGAGTFFETRAGIFTFNYGLARQFDNPILVRNARLSFGFRNLF